MGWARYLEAGAAKGSRSETSAGLARAEHS